MATPTPSEYPSLALARQGVEYRFKIRCRALELDVRPLSIAEEDKIAQDVAEAMEKLPVARQTSIRQTALLSVTKLELAQTSAPGVSDGKVFAIELNRMTPGEIDTLFKQYVAGADKVNPVFDHMPAEKVDQVVEILKKSSLETATMLTELSFFQLVDICLHLLRPTPSPTGSSTG